MASKKVQTEWTGSFDITLLQQSIDFVKSVVHFYEDYTKSLIKNATFLDFGCGWGRLLRLFLKYIPEDQIYGVDPWDQSIDVCKEHKVKGTLGMTDYICRSLPFTNVGFDLIIAFSVFTHLSFTAATEALKTLYRFSNKNCVLVISVRPREYWSVHNDNTSKVPVEQILKDYDTNGFAFYPHNHRPVEGEITFGDTAISLDFIRRTWTDWKIVGVDVSLYDPYQQYVFLSPVF